MFIRVNKIEAYEYLYLVENALIVPEWQYVIDDLAEPAASISGTPAR
jgi:hypothetical protein